MWLLAVWEIARDTQQATASNKCTRVQSLLRRRRSRIASVALRPRVPTPTPTPARRRRPSFPRAVPPACPSCSPASAFPPWCGAGDPIRATPAPHSDLLGSCPADLLPRQIRRPHVPLLPWRRRTASGARRRGLFEGWVGGGLYPLLSQQEAGAAAARLPLQSAAVKRKSTRSLLVPDPPAPMTSFPLPPPYLVPANPSPTLPPPVVPANPAAVLPAPLQPQQTGSAQLPATLLVRHLPEAIPLEMLSGLFSHYGATSVRPCASGKLRNCAFVDFRDEGAANQAQSQLNRLRFLGKVLTVERANQPNANKTNEKHQEHLAHRLPQLPSMNAPDRKNPTSAAESIAPKLGVEYPFPPHLEYAYPPPDGNILTNIVNALIAVPRFYTQVLHLMNKMNLPAPFRMALPTPPLPSQMPAAAPPPPELSTTERLHVADLSSDESELESSDDDADKRKSKRAKHEAIVGPAVDKSVAHESVGVKPASLVSSEIQVIKKKNPVLQIKIASKVPQKEDTDQSIDKESASRDEQLEEKQFVPPQDIEKEKLPPEEILSLPMFKNYAPGNPTTVLYVKNLAKDVIHDDFYYLFGSLFESMETAKSFLSIKLMQEGRMRGQAFVTFPSVELAQRALNLVHGYVFKGKPMIIQFGRNPATNKTS